MRCLTHTLNDTRKRILKRYYVRADIFAAAYARDHTGLYTRHYLDLYKLAFRSYTNAYPIANERATFDKRKLAIAYAAQRNQCGAIPRIANVS